MNGPDTYRKILHIDMDAFYASIEQRDAPQLRGRPVAVGGSRERGVVAAASYEARAYGVHSAMPSLTAARLCPELIFVRPRFDHYRAVSQQIRAIFGEYTDLVEPLSLDEAYLDVTENKMGLTTATGIARDICRRIQAETGLTASAGISVNKFLAKVASDIHKPAGITLIHPDRMHRFLEKLPIKKFHGIGAKTAEKMRRMGIHTGADLKARTELELARHFGKAGRHYYRIVRALDERPVQPDRLRKSVGAEHTFSHDLDTAEAMLAELRHLTAKVCRRLAALDTGGRTVTVKIKYHDFEIHTRSRSVGTYLRQEGEIFPLVEELLHQPALPERAVRLLGVTLSGLALETADQGQQLTLDF